MKLNKFLSLLCVSFLAIGTVACGDSDSSSGGGSTDTDPTTRGQTANDELTAQTSAVIADAIGNGFTASSSALVKGAITREEIEEFTYTCLDDSEAESGTATYSGEFDGDSLYSLTIVFDDCNGIDGTVTVEADYSAPNYTFTYTTEDPGITSDDCTLTYDGYGYGYNFDDEESTYLLSFLGSFSVDCGADGSASCDFGDDGVTVDFASETLVDDLVAVYTDHCE